MPAPESSHQSPLRLAPTEKHETVRLTVDGVVISAVAGESIAAALTAARQLKLPRDKNDRPRGMLCGMGSCFECQVSVNGGQPQRACLTAVADSMNVSTLSYRHTTPESSDTAVKQQQLVACDVLVVGAGPAGASAAVRLADSGKQVIVIDERPAAGGQFFKQKIAAVKNDGDDDRQYRDGRRLIRQLSASAAQTFFGATVWGAFRQAEGGLEVTATTAESSLTLRPKTLIVATGAYESIPPFPGWTLPGVMATGAAQTLLRSYRIAPGQRVLIAGNGPLNLQLACELARNGVDIAAVAESAAATLPGRFGAALRMAAASPRLCFSGLGYLRELRKLGVPVYYKHRIDRANGRDSVSEATIVKTNDAGMPQTETKKTLAVDAVCLGYRQRSSAELLKALGCRMTVSTEGIEVVDRDADGMTSIAGVYAIGDSAAPMGAQTALSDGRLLADYILAKPATRRDRLKRRRQRRFQRALWEFFAAPQPPAIPADITVCRCESVSAITLRALIAEGVQDLNELKRESRAGMGPCQGRYCTASLVSLLAEAAPGRADNPLAFVGRNPVKPVIIADIVREQPEWRGYRTVVVPPKAPLSCVRTTDPDECDVLVIGAGVIGTACTLYIARSGLNVILVDAGCANGEASGGNAGSLHLQLLPFDFRLGEQTSAAAETLPLQKLGIELWQQLDQELDGDFELSIGGGLMLASNDDDLDFLQQKVRLEDGFGVTSELLSAQATQKLLPGAAARIAGGAFCAGEGKINPLLATPRLLTAALHDGAQLRESTSVTSIDASAGGYRVVTSGGVINCHKIVNAAGAWSADIAAMLGCALPVQAAPQQMLVTEAVEPQLPFLLSLAQRHLSMKQAANGNLIIGGGWPAAWDKENGRGVTRSDSIAGNLWAAQRIYPAAGRLQLLRSWAAVGVMIDGAPIVGELPGYPGFYNVVGANGYTMAPALALLTAELITAGRTSINLQPFSVERFDARPAAKPDV